jgi:hypothetical protein
MLSWAKETLLNRLGFTNTIRAVQLAEKDENQTVILLNKRIMKSLLKLIG